MAGNKFTMDEHRKRMRAILNKKDGQQPQKTTMLVRLRDMAAKQSKPTMRKRV